MKQTYAEMTKEAKIMSQELQSLETEKMTIADAFEASNQAIAFANDQIERTREMITRAIYFCPRPSRCVKLKLPS